MSVWLPFPIHMRMRTTRRHHLRVMCVRLVHHPTGKAGGALQGLARTPASLPPSCAPLRRPGQRGVGLRRRAGCKRAKGGAHPFPFQRGPPVPAGPSRHPPSSRVELPCHFWDRTRTPLTRRLCMREGGDSYSRRPRPVTWGPRPATSGIARGTPHASPSGARGGGGLFPRTPPSCGGAAPLLLGSCGAARV